MPKRKKSRRRKSIIDSVVNKFPTWFHEEEDFEHYSGILSDQDVHDDFREVYCNMNVLLTIFFGISMMFAIAFMAWVGNYTWDKKTMQIL